MAYSNPNNDSPQEGGGSDQFQYYHVGTGRDYATAALAIAAAEAAAETDAVLVLHEDLSEHVTLSVENFAAMKSGLSTEACSVYIDRLTINGDSDRTFAREGIGVIGVDGEDVVHVDGDSTLVFYNVIDGLKLVAGAPDVTHAPGRILFQRHPDSNITYRKSFLFKLNALGGSEKGALEFRGTVNINEESTLQVPSGMVGMFANTPYTLSNVVNGPVAALQTVLGDDTSAEGVVEEVIDNYVIFSSVTGTFQDESFTSGLPSGDISIATVNSHEVKDGCTINGQIRGRVTSDFYFEFSKFDGSDPLFEVEDEALISFKRCSVNGGGGEVVAGDGNLTYEDTNFRGGTFDGDLTIVDNTDYSYFENLIAGGVTYKGGYDASTNTPDLDTTPANVKAGDMYTVTVAGTFFTVDVEVGDVIISEKDDPSVEADWTIVNKNLDAASIKTAYESNADTNAFTDAEKTKLSNLDENGGGSIDPDLALYAYLDGDVATPNSTATTIPFDTELEDGDAAYNTGTGIYTVPTNGTYEFNVQITHSGNTDIEAVIELDTGGGYVEVGRGTTASGVDSSSTLVYTAELQAGDLIRVRADNLTGTNATVRGQTYYGTNETFLYIMTYDSSTTDPNSPVVTTAEIDFTTTGLTTLYVPTGGKKLIVQQVIFELTQYNSPNADGSAAFGVSGPGYSDYKSPITFSNANAVGDIEPFDVFIGVPAVTDFVPVTSANPLVLNISSADTGVALAAKAHVIGYLIPA